MHQIYHTEAVVLKSSSHGEANKRVWLFTKELGVVVATVQGVRKSGAKLASHIVDYAKVYVDLVQGKDVWRLISARSIDTPIYGKERTSLARAYVRTLAAVERFLVGEGADTVLYEHVQACIMVLKEKNFDAKFFDTLSLWKMLVYLGYIAPAMEDEDVAKISLIEAYPYMNEVRHKRFLQSVKIAIEQSHL